VGRASSRVNEGWGRLPIRWLPDLTTDGGIRATCNLAEGGKKGSVVDRGKKPAKNAEMREETLGSEEGLKKKKVSSDHRNGD
jgi:hypothetical protein